MKSATAENPDEPAEDRAKKPDPDNEREDFGLDRGTELFTPFDDGSIVDEKHGSYSRGDQSEDCTGGGTPCSTFAGIVIGDFTNEGTCGSTAHGATRT